MNPPLTRLPKKSKLYGWQCSECDKTSDSEVDVKEKGARRSRTRHSKDNTEIQNEVFAPKVKIKPVEPHYPDTNPDPENHVSHPYNYSFNNSTEQTSNTLVCTTSIDGSEINNDQCYIIGGKSGKKRRRDKHRSHNSQDDGNPSREHKRKRKKKSLDIENPNNNSHPRITIKIKSIPLPAGEVASTSNPQCFYVPKDNEETPKIPQRAPQPLQHLSPTPRTSRLTNTPKKTPTKEGDQMTNCDVCSQPGSNANLVRYNICFK